MANEFPTLTGTEEKILRLLMEHGQSYGLKMIELSEGSLKRGSIYVLLDRLEDKGFVESKKEPPSPDQPGPPRRVYEITGAGARVLSAYEGFRSRIALVFALETGE